MFKVHWRGYAEAEDTFEPIANFADISILTAYASTCTDKDKDKILKSIKAFKESKSKTS
ncbi:hypothetical protein GGI12_005838, partial [Dipsacomyces acuminosporus]